MLYQLLEVPICSVPRQLSLDYFGTKETLKILSRVLVTRTFKQFQGRLFTVDIRDNDISGKC